MDKFKNLTTKETIQFPNLKGVAVASMLTFLTFLYACKRQLSEQQLHLVKPDAELVSSLEKLFNNRGEFVSTAGNLFIKSSSTTEEISYTISILGGHKVHPSMQIYFKKTPNGGIEVIDREENVVVQDEGENKVFNYKNRFSVVEVNGVYYITEAEFYPNHSSLVDDNKVMLVFDPKTRSLSGNFSEGQYSSGVYILNSLIGFAVNGDKSFIKQELDPKN